MTASTTIVSRPEEQDAQLLALVDVAPDWRWRRAGDAFCATQHGRDAAMPNEGRVTFEATTGQWVALLVAFPRWEPVVVPTTADTPVKAWRLAVAEATRRGLL